MVALWLAGCDQPSKEMQDKFAALEKAQSEMSARLATLQTRTAKLETSQSTRDYMDDLKGMAYLTPGGEGYQAIEYTLGTLTVSLEDVRPYANGTRVILNFGNPTAAIVTGVSMDLEWGQRANDASTTKSRHITLPDDFRAGSWNRVPVVLDGVPPADFGFVRVNNFQNTGIKLSRDFRQ
jgi:hypothetical protein